ncbi:MAG TPA: UPF0104 family protein, partial [Pseudomonadales bacterium]
EVMRGYGVTTLVGALALAAAGHLLYTLYDLLGARYTGHGLRPAQVMKIAFVSYAFNLNMGPLIGAMGFRYRLYSRFGLDSGVITRVLGFSIVSNWLGYLLLGGVLFAWPVVEVPRDWAIGTLALRVVGAAMLALVAVYLWLCARARRRRFTVRGVEVELPPLPMAGLQLAISCASWLSIGMIIYLLLQQQIGFPTVMGVLLVGAVAAVATHIPAGLGVLEASFVLLLGDRMAAPELLAGVLAYRVFFYLLPLAVATGLFLFLEARAKRRPAPAH